MHQTFYIDIDEEITSIAERLRNAEATEVIMVVPKQAALIQSIVNLKLLGKEADKLGIKLVMVTQDKMGRVLIEKAGIAVEQKLEDVQGEEIFIDETQSVTRGVPKDAEKEVSSVRKTKKIGSDSYFDAAPKEEKVLIIKKEEPSRESFFQEEEIEEKITNKELITGIASDIKKRKGTRMDLSARVIPKKEIHQKNIQHPKTGRLHHPIEISKDFSERKIEQDSRILEIRDEAKNDRKKEERLESFFAGNGEFARENVLESSHRKGKSKVFKYILSFAALIAGCGVLYLAYLFVPMATIAITTKKETKSADIQITGDAKSGSADYDKKIIPAKLIEVENQITDNFSVSGKSSISSKKAHGKVVIYNEFSTSSQPLVATTRLESSGGKIFRITQSVVVPGMTKTADETKPGQVEVEVTADNSGDEYNIGPDTFTIPGFKGSGSDKYSKFYAKSTESMLSGGSANTGTQAGSIADSDITGAKNKLITDLNNSLKQKIKDAAGDGMIVLSDAVNFEDPVYKISASAGEVANSFNASVSGRAQAIVFSENDVKKMANDIVAKSGGGKSNLDANKVSLDYGKSDVDFKAETVVIKAHAVSSVASNIDVDNLRMGILGKDSSELENYLKTYPSIEKAEVTYWPPIIVNRIPMYEKRVIISVDSVDSSND